MAVKKWESIKVRRCERVGREVSLDAEVILPPEWLPDLEARVVSHRCSYASACNLDNRGACVWAGSNPAYDPFKEN